MNQCKPTRREVITGIAGAAGAAMFGCQTGHSTYSATHHHAASSVNWRLGLDTYTLHRSLSAKDPALKRSLWSVLETLGDYGLSGVQIDPSHFPGDDEATLSRLRSIVEPHGHYVEFGMGGWDVQRLRERIVLTSRFGGRAVRTFFGGELTPPEKIKEWMGYALPAMKEAGKIAADHNIAIAIENHGDVTGPQLRAFLEDVDHPSVGCCFDTGNALFVKEDPIECAKVLAPFTLSMHLKNWTMRFREDGHPVWEEKPLLSGTVPMRKVLRIIADEKPDLYVALETPVRDSDNETETVEREWRHYKVCTAQAVQLVNELGADA